MGLLSNLLKIKADKEQQQAELRSAMRRQMLQSQAAEREAKAARRHSSSEKEKDRAASSGEAQADRTLREALAERQRQQRKSEFDTEQATKQRDFERAGTWRNEDIARNQERQQYLDDRKMEDRDTEEARYQEGLDREDRRLADSEVLRNATREQARQKQFRDMVADDPEAAARLYRTDPEFYSAFGVSPEELSGMAEDRRQKALDMEEASAGIKANTEATVRERLADATRRAKQQEETGDPVIMAKRQAAEKSLALDELLNELAGIGNDDIAGLKSLYEKSFQSGKLGVLADAIKQNIRRFQGTADNLRTQREEVGRIMDRRDWQKRIVKSPSAYFNPFGGDFYGWNPFRVLQTTFNAGPGDEMPQEQLETIMNDPAINWLLNVLPKTTD